MQQLKMKQIKATLNAKRNDASLLRFRWIPKVDQSINKCHKLSYVLYQLIQRGVNLNINI